MTIEQLKLQIKEVIFPNGKNEIDGGKHQGVLLDLVDKFDVDIRDLDRALKELSDELNKKVDNEAYNIDKEAIENSISENKTAIEFITKEVDKKLEKVYVDGTSIQGYGTKENPISSTIPSDFEELLSYGEIGRASCRERV